MKESPEWSSDDIQKYENEKNRFLKEKSKKRKAYKKGEITFGELRDWLLHQEVEAQESLESLMVTIGQKTSNCNTFCALGKDEVASSNLANVILNFNKQTACVQSDAGQIY